MIVTLGYHCNITFLNQNVNIKKETGAFEWFECRKLQYITNLINTLIVNRNINNVVRGKDKHIYLIDQFFFSHHYNIEEYKLIFQRRYNRFINIIQNEKIVYFIRLNPLNVSTLEIEINHFLQTIKIINPNLKINFLLIDTVINETDLKLLTINQKNVNFFHKIFLQKDINDIYMRQPNEILHKKYKDMLKEIGYNINDIVKTEFNDKS